MKFKAKPVHDLTDVTLDLEQLETRDILDQSSTSILQLAVTGTKRKLAFGSSTVTFTASPTSATTTVTHGLGATPQVVFAQTVTAFVGFTTFTFTSTQFSVQGFNTANSASTGTFAFLWLAVG